MPPEDLASRAAVAALLRSRGIRPSKHLGQNFLVDRSVLNRIVSEVRVCAPREVVEIGAGLGTVTRELAALAERVLAVEIDARLADGLERSLGDLANVEVRRGDFLKLDLHAIGEGPVFVVGSIPYRITAPILNHLVDSRGAISGVILLTQSEVARKIAASPGVEGSSLGVRVRAYGDVTRLREVPRSSFYPVPEVDSTLWRLVFLEAPRFSAGEEVFFALVRTLYGKRRKMIRGALRDLLPAEGVAEVIRAAAIDPTVRGETLSFEELDRLAIAVSRTVGAPQDS